MTCKFVLKCIIREKLLVDKNELIKAVAKTFSIKICFFLEYLTYMYVCIHTYIHTYIHIYIYIYTYIYIFIGSSWVHKLFYCCHLFNNWCKYFHLWQLGTSITKSSIIILTTVSYKSTLNK